MRLTHIRNLDLEAPIASGHRFLSAASGLVRVGDTLCVVADDANHLALFREGEPGRLVRLLDGDLPQDAKARKKVKPDFEILLALGDDRLLAMGSGSKKKRRRGVMIELSADPQVAVIDLKPLFAAIEPLVPEINIEGAVADGDRLLMFNRGNMAAPETQILETSLSQLLAEDGVAARLVQQFALPTIDRVPFTATDACLLDDGTILLSAVAEVTDNSYADGMMVGAAFLLLDAALKPIALEPIEPVVKIEGIIASRGADGIEIYCVSDADDPEQPAALYSARWRA